ncbi:MAG: PilZ domain-containing protein [candidate division Zixibacteria bacterium]|nr:PilZ domain-containing protein [candidate division Zixibacteria bacterium]
MSKSSQKTTKQKITSAQTKKSNERKAVRLDFAGPFKFQKINLPANKNKEIIDHKITHGMILNISGSGLLAAIDTTLKVNSYIVMTIELENLEKAEKILGKVKRSEKLEYSEYLTGIEFINPDNLYAEISPTDRDLIEGEVFSFKDSIQNLVVKYAVTKQREEK